MYILSKQNVNSHTVHSESDTNAGKKDNLDTAEDAHTINIERKVTKYCSENTFYVF